MRKMPIVGILLLLPAFMMFAAVGCKDTKKTETPSTDNNKSSVGPSASKTPIDKPTDAVIKGFVKYKGTAPKPEIDPRIIMNDKDAPFCLTAAEKAGMINVEKQMWIIGKDNGVANVVISLSPPSDKTFKITDALKAPFEKPVEMDQPFCMYRPHVIAIYADIQPVVFKNTAKVSHNVTVGTNPPFQKVISSDESVKIPSLPKYKDPIPVSCTIHNWMTANILTFDNPYFAVSKEDGSFEIKNVPIDTELKVFWWHESSGKHELKKQSFKAGDNTVDFSISAQ